MLMLKKGKISSVEMKRMWDEEGIAEILDVRRKMEELNKRYKNVKEIGINMEHLKEGFDKFVQRRAEEIITSGYLKRTEEDTGMHF